MSGGGRGQCGARRRCDRRPDRDHGWNRRPGRRDAGARTGDRNGGRRQRRRVDDRPDHRRRRGDADRALDLSPDQRARQSNRRGERRQGANRCDDPRPPCPHAPAPFCRTTSYYRHRQRGPNLEGESLTSFRLKLVVYFLLLSLLPLAAAFSGFAAALLKVIRRLDSDSIFLSSNSTTRITRVSWAPGRAT